MSTFHIVDKVYKETGVTLTDSEGFEYPEKEAIAGYHVNMLDVEDMDLVSSYVVTVNTPQTVFAGRSDTIYLKFQDRAEWLSLDIEKEDEL